MLSHVLISIKILPFSHRKFYLEEMEKTHTHTVKPLSHKINQSTSIFEARKLLNHVFQLDSRTDHCQLQKQQQQQHYPNFTSAQENKNS